MPLEERIRQIVRDELASQGNRNTFSVAQVPRHVHNGIDSLTIPFLNIGNVPNSYEGKAGKVATVNATESGLEFDDSAPIGGSNTEIQFNNAGALGGDPNLTWDSADVTLTVGVADDIGAVNVLIDGGDAIITTPDTNGGSITASSSLLLETGSSAGTDSSGSIGIYTAPLGVGSGGGGSIEIIAAGGLEDTSVNANTIATTATKGFVYIPKCAGIPTGVPTRAGTSGGVPMVFDSTNNKLYVYKSGWKGVTLT